MRPKKLGYVKYNDLINAAAQEGKLVALSGRGKVKNAFKRFNQLNKAAKEIYQVTIDKQLFLKHAIDYLLDDLDQNPLELYLKAGGWMR
ncbi:MAG: hypothetical protein XE08_0197 [Parcubacteria bacterium 32_520]|nr:MAG: hypothetical protein XE08_0197 [Parcubacteria bacterium 32_520]